MLSDYSQAFLDITDSDPNTKSYEKMLPPNYSIEGKEARFQAIFKSKKDTFRRFRDLSIFAFGGVYLLSVIDARVVLLHEEERVGKGLKQELLVITVFIIRSIDQTCQALLGFHDGLVEQLLPFLLGLIVVSLDAIIVIKGEIVVERAAFVGIAERLCRLQSILEMHQATVEFLNT